MQQTYHTLLQSMTESLLSEYNTPDTLTLKPCEPFEVAFDVKRNVDTALAR